MMKAKKAVDLVDERYPNDYSSDEKYEWLKQIEDKVVNEVYKTHEEAYEVPDLLWVTSVDVPSADLCIPDRYAETVYTNYLLSKIALLYHEIDKYNDAMTVFFNEYEEFKRDYHRTHTPKQTYLCY